MRLINADKFLERVCTYKDTGCGSCKLQTMCPKDAQTVKAIPIEWIEKWFSQFYGEQGLEWNRCKRFMLEDWEKENETN